MKKLYPTLIISLLFLSVGLSQQEYNVNDLKEMDNEYDISEITFQGKDFVVEKITYKPVTGTIYQNYTGPKLILGKVKKGKQYGKWTSWYPDGVKSIEVNYTNGKMNGYYIEYYDTGLKEKDGYFSNNKKIGKWTYYYEDESVRYFEDCDRKDCY